MSQNSTLDGVSSIVFAPRRAHSHCDRREINPSAITRKRANTIICRTTPLPIFNTMAVNTTNSNASNMSSLTNILHNDIQCLSFMKYCEMEHSDINIKIWKCLQSIKSACNDNDHESFMLICKQLYNQYFNTSDDEEHVLNLNSNTIRSIKSKLIKSISDTNSSQLKYTSEFIRVESEIELNLADTFDRYLLSQFH
jgi:hypothetical protein